MYHSLGVGFTLVKRKALIKFTAVKLPDPGSGPAPITPLRPKIQSKSSEKLGGGGGSRGRVYLVEEEDCGSVDVE